MEATAGPSSIRFGFTDPCLTTQVGLIVWPHFPRQVGFRAAHGGTPPSFIDQPHRLSSPRHRLAIPERSGTADMALSETSPYPQSSPEFGQPEARSAFLPRIASEVGTDLRAVRHRRRGAFGEIALPPEASLENPNPIGQLQLSPEDLLGRDRSPSGPAEGWTARPG